jgi:hypothetical protein
MRKILLVVCALLMVSSFAFAKEKEPKTVKVDTDILANRAKVGVQLGQPHGIVFGYHFNKTIEGNILAGTNAGFDYFVLGGNALFTVINFDVGKTVLPFSIGPAVFANFDDPFNMDILGVARLEYNFKDAPVNLYIEGGLGVNAFDNLDLGWTAAAGVRYAFQKKAPKKK